MKKKERTIIKFLANDIFKLERHKTKPKLSFPRNNCMRSVYRIEINVDKKTSKQDPVRG